MKQTLRHQAVLGILSQNLKWNGQFTGKEITFLNLHEPNNNKVPNCITQTCQNYNEKLAKTQSFYFKTWPEN